MKIQDLHFYHGSALTQIAEHESFKALNKTDAKYGHYRVNTDRQLFVKYRTNRRSPWHFTFQLDETAAIRRAIETKERTFVCLVCGRNTICCLRQEELEQLVDIRSRVQQWIRVEVPKGGSLHVTGKAGALSRTIPHNSFPSKVFE